MSLLFGNRKNIGGYLRLVVIAGNFLQRILNLQDLGVWECDDDFLGLMMVYFIYSSKPTELWK